MARNHRDFERRKRKLLLDRLQAILDLGRAEIEDRLSSDGLTALRINPLKDRPAEETLQRLEELGADLEPIPWCPDAYFLHSEKRTVSESELFQQGFVYLQNASSLVPPLALDPQPGDSILDVCAAPGGKAAHLAALVGNRAELWLNDGVKPRVAKMIEILSHLEVRYDQVTQHPGQYLSKLVDRQFDRILLDAQCSGEGMLRLDHPRALRFWSPGRIEKFSRLQKKMLVSAFELLKPGGRLVYSTCTFGPEENEEPVSRLLKIRPEASVEPIELDLPDTRPGLTSWQGAAFDSRLARAVRILPSRTMEGFFVCRIVKEPDAGAAA